MREGSTKYVRADAPTKSAAAVTACCAAVLTVAVVAVRRARLRWRMRHVPIMRGHVPLLGRVQTLKVRLKRLACVLALLHANLLAPILQVAACV